MVVRSAALWAMTLGAISVAAPISGAHACLAQYNTNKTGTGNGGLKWIQKGGGYYSECNKRLKG